MRRALSIAVLLASYGSALAAEMPHFDVAAHCKRVASFGGSYSETMFDGCMEMEQSAYNQLMAVWSNLNNNMRDQCMKIATFGGPGSYTMLQGCVQMETSAADKNKNRQFKY